MLRDSSAVERVTHNHEVAGSTPAPASSSGSTPPESPLERCKRLFNELTRVRYSALAHLRTHAVGTFCHECQRFIDSDAEAQAAYTAAWQALFAPGGASPAPTKDK